MKRPGNGGLRQLDWRYLLPTRATGADPTLWLSDAASHLALFAVEAGFEPVAGHGAVASVVLRRAEERCSLESSIRHLASDAVLCWQVDRRVPHTRFVTPVRAVAALRRLGLDDARVYWTRGTHDSPTAFVPVHRPAPLRWFLQNALERRFWQLSVGAARFIARIAAGFGGCVPAFTVTAARRAGERALVPAALTETSSGLDDVIFTMGGEGDWSRVAAFPFQSDGTAPEIVIKLPRAAAFNARTRHERVVLQALSATAGRLRETIPRPLGEVRLGALTGSMEARLAGRPLHLSSAASSDRRRAVDLLYAATEWLIALARTPCPGADRPAGAIRGFAPTLEAYAATFQMSPVEADLIAGTLARAADLGASKIPICWEHHDLGPWNILLSGRDIRIIDWEVARPGFGLADLVYLVLHWTWTARGIEGEPARAAALLELLDPVAPRDELGAAAHDAIARYVDALNLDPHLVDPALIHTLAEQALDRVERLRDSGDPNPARREGNRYVAYLEAIARSRAAAGVLHHPSPLVLS